jgi:branched-chain amino acid transport system permease protein
MLASGLALIYGLRDVINFGHGAISCSARISVTRSRSSVDFGWRWSWCRSCSRCSALPSISGAASLQGRSHIEVALVTLGLGIILGQIIIFFYGGVARSVDAPQICRVLSRS